jgi:ribosome-binding protein aMBF1 (putative translation factor)
MGVDLAQRAEMTDDEIKRIEEGGTEPTVALIRRLELWGET